MLWDVTVVGLGGVGSFALRAAAQIAKELQQTPKQNTTISNHCMKILGIEKFKPGHEFGSSHGKSRIYRHAYFEHPNYVPLIQYSTKEFQRLQDQCVHNTSMTSKVNNRSFGLNENSRSLLEECGTLIIEDEDVKDSIIDKCLGSARKHNIKVEELSPSALEEKYPQFLNLNHMKGLLEYKSGFVRPELAIEKALIEAKENGANILDNMHVHDVQEIVDPNDSNEKWVEISLSSKNDHGSADRKVIKSRMVIIAAGSWTTKLIPSWSSLLTVTRQIQAWIDVNQVDKPIMYHPTQLPTWFLSTHRLDIPFYGIPTDPYSNIPSHIKIALHGRNVEIDPDSRNPAVTNAEKDELLDALHIFFKDANILNLDISKSCKYTMTPDEHFLVGKPKEFSNVYAAAGLSGHGFKMAPGLGKVLADLAIRGETDFDVDFLSPTRFFSNSEMKG